MSDNPSYQPPYVITPAIISLIAEISEAVGRLAALNGSSSDLKLRKLNQVKTIQGSLAIEGNTLNEEQVSAIFEGKRVLAPPKDILEVKNALAAYESLGAWSPSKERDLLEAHRMLMAKLVDNPGVYRSKGVGVVSGDKLVHMAPPGGRVPILMRNLLLWLQNSEEHPLVAGSVFHYEFEFIHPFEDGNGRLGRLWQTLILNRWNDLFLDIPVESLIYNHQQEYFTALQESTNQTDSGPFICFMLKMIQKAVASAVPQVTPQVTPQVGRLLRIMQGAMTREELQQALGLSDRKSFRERYLKPALEAGLIKMTIPDKPSSRLQKYRLTNKGEITLTAL
ncbi:filamentation induced by cAMP protein Fic [Desulfatibacillum aliphaticivorans]|uniref:Filamentation induced by cAMP protein Fic n=1 Tax=Desulfatibacillum aliphaticivorans TaxID=218208 RepID=B8FG94_DESAL|nr:Fic family protein [Desulfatibacillum aliphaticivorans]ACL03774.1 filamentation induced by cAMP protein Fic [Desulfatibacillum aliphaticivorans]